MAALERGKIDSTQLVILLTLTRLLAILIDAPTFSDTPIGHDAWLAIVISSLLAVIWILFLVHLGNMFPQMTIIQYSQEILGPWFGRLVGLLVVLFFLQESARAVRVCGGAYTIAVMPETPTMVFIGVITFLSANAVRNGLEVIARASSMVFAITLVLFALLIMLPINQMEFANLLPVLAGGWSTLLDAVMVSLSMYADLLIITMIMPYLSESEMAGKDAVRAILLSGFLMVALAVAVAVTFGPVMSSLNMPAFSLGRLVQFALIVERVEIIPLVAWTVGTGVKQSILLWAAMLGIAQLFNLSAMQQLAYPLGALVAALALWLYDNTIEKADFVGVKSFGVLSLLIGLGIPLLLYVVYKVRRLATYTTAKGE